MRCTLSDWFLTPRQVLAGPMKQIRMSTVCNEFHWYLWMLDLYVLIDIITCIACIMRPCMLLSHPFFFFFLGSPLIKHLSWCTVIKMIGCNWWYAWPYTVHCIRYYFAYFDRSDWLDYGYHHPSWQSGHRIAHELGFIELIHSANMHFDLNLKIAHLAWPRNQYANNEI